MKEFKLSTNKELQKQVQDDINKQLNKIKQTKQPKKKKELTVEDIKKQQIENLKKEKNIVKNMTPHQLAVWLMEKHNEFVGTCNRILHTDCMNCENYDDRTIKILYLHELNDLLFVFGIEEFDQETINFLDDKNEIDLLIILRVLGFIS